jgi:hypothetical protein
MGIKRDNAKFMRLAMRSMKSSSSSEILALKQQLARLTFGP